MTEKVGKVGRFNRLTPKGHNFIDALETWCHERGIDKKDLSKFLRHAPLYTALREHWGFPVEDVLGSTVEFLVEEGYLEEAEG